MPQRSKALCGFWAFAALTPLVVASCSDPGTLDPVDDLAPLVGDWEAYVMEVSPRTGSDPARDLLDEGASFSLNVQPSGQYTAALSILGASQVEIGTLVRDGDMLTLFRAVPTADTSSARYTAIGSDRMRLEGGTRFDFHGDGTPEDADLLTELQRVEGGT